MTKEAKIDRILELTNSSESATQMMDQMKSMLLGQMKTMAPKTTPEELAKMQDMQQKIMDLVQSRMSWDKMRPEYARVYADTFTDQEIDGLLAFYESTAGRGYLQKLPILTKKMIEFSQANLRISCLKSSALPKKQPSPNSRRWFLP